MKDKMNIEQATKFLNESGYELIKEGYDTNLTDSLKNELNVIFETLTDKIQEEDDCDLEEAKFQACTIIRKWLFEMK